MRTIELESLKYYWSSSIGTSTSTHQYISNVFGSYHNECIAASQPIQSIDSKFQRYKHFGSHWIWTPVITKILEIFQHSGILFFGKLNAPEMRSHGKIERKCLLNQTNFIYINVWLISDAFALQLLTFRRCLFRIQIERICVSIVGLVTINQFINDNISLYCKGN